MKLPACTAAFLLLFLLASCGGDAQQRRQGERAEQQKAEPVPVPEKSVIDELLDTGKLLVLTRNAPTTHYEGPLRTEGFEHDLVVSFAESLGVEPVFIIKESISDILDALERGEGHVAAAGLSHTPGRAARFLAGPPYGKVTQQVVSRRGQPMPRSIEELVGRQIEVVSKSSYTRRLRELKKDHPGLAWAENGEAGTEQLLHAVWREELELTIADDNIVAINRRYFPELIVAFDLSAPESLVWYFPAHADSLLARSRDWLGAFRASGKLEQLEARYYGHIDQFDYVDTRTFIRRIDERLPRYRPLFEEVADLYGIRWTIPAAISYQESHWNPRAKSPTGVRGMMMLSLPTARELGVENRLDPEQSVHGGMRYLAGLYNRLPDSIEPPDRAWFALAAYNVGMGHLYDARTLARRLGKDPDLWHDMEEVLPLLAQEKYYKTLRYGYARGYEPVRYVNRIRDYEDILRRQVAE